MLGQLPYEIRFYVFKIVFCDATFRRGLVQVTKKGGVFVSNLPRTISVTNSAVPSLFMKQGG